MNPVDTTVFLPAPRGFIKVEAKKPSETRYLHTTIAISDILRIRPVAQDPDLSIVLTRSTNQDGVSHELVVKATHSKITANIEANKLPSDALPEE